MRVQRVHTEHGSHIEPELDPSWSDLTKLRWHAAVTEADAGVQVKVIPAEYQIKRFGRWSDVPGLYSLSVGSSSSGPHTFDRAWSYLNGITTGAREATR